MADDAMNTCEYFDSQLTVQWLLNILQQMQDYCTDTECLDVSRLPGSPAPRSSWNEFFATLLLIGFIGFMYVFRPNSLRRNVSTSAKSEQTLSAPDNDPPAPPRAH